VVARIVAPRVLEQISQEMNSIAVPLKTQMQVFVNAEPKLWEPYIQEPSITVDIRRNISIIEKAEPFYQSNFADLATAMRKIQGLVDMGCRINPAFESSETGSPAHGKEYENIASKAEQTGQAYQNLFDSLLRYNRALLKTDRTATTYQKESQSARAQAESAHREFVLSLQQISRDSATK
jgi:hypothetical protein